MIFYVHQDFHDGSRKAGDELTADEYAVVKETPDLYNVLSLPDDARGRLNMRDVAPNRPVGAAPSLEHAREHAAASVHANVAPEGPPPVYVGGAEADPAIRNPDAKEREKDARTSPDEIRLAELPSGVSPASNA